MAKFKRIKGTQDILPEESKHWQELERLVRSCMEVYNYKELRTPIFEQTELFARGIGQLTDIVSKEMYSFIDRGKKNLTLKPEMTAPIIRAYLENNLAARSPLNKIYYISALFRQENPQAGRLRQFNQFGAESIGSASADVDVEIILLALEIYQRLGLRSLTLRLNSVGDLTCREPYKRQLQSYFKPLLKQYCSECKIRFEKNPLRILDCKEASCQNLNAAAPKLIENLCHDCQQHFEIVKSALQACEIPYELNPYLVRGLDYYTRTVFEITSSELGSQDALCGGGRYDLLAEELGGPPTPAVGFASGIERLLMVLEAEQSRPGDNNRLQIFISPLGTSGSDQASIWAQRLRKMGYRVDRDYLQRSLKAQMREANRQNALLVFLLGDDEIAGKKFSVKEMDSGKQHDVSFQKVESFLSSFFSENKN